MIYFKKYIFTRYFININDLGRLFFTFFIIIKNKITRTLR